jgi:hypothetical protein
MTDMFKALFGDATGSGWYKHRNALLGIVGLRGGFNTISKENLRITLTWYVLGVTRGLYQPTLQR